MFILILVWKSADMPSHLRPFVYLDCYEEIQGVSLLELDAIIVPAFRELDIGLPAAVSLLND